MLKNYLFYFFFEKNDMKFIRNSFDFSVIKKSFKKYFFYYSLEIYLMIFLNYFK